MTTRNEQMIHATAVALPDSGGGWCGVLLRGPSGSGKSDLAFRLLSSHGGRMVADDQSLLRRHQQAIICASVPVTEGLLEVRGIGLLRLSGNQLMAQAPLALVVDLVGREAVPRLPAEKTVSFLGIDIPALALHAFDSSIPDKIIMALAIVGGRQSVIR